LIDTSVPKIKASVSLAKFNPGIVVATPGALAKMEKHHVAAIDLIGMHLSGYWGDTCGEDREANESALKYGGRLMSVYKYDLDKFWVITEADRSATTILLPEEY
jgi:hypothetical protein